MCSKYNEDIWVNNKYGIDDITDEASPLYIFTELKENDYDDIAEGIHNFMLFWDDYTKQYTLVTSYFNAFEFGSKHNIISLRTLDQTPDTFIISGEIKKIGRNIHFHDTSSQFFQDNPCNIKRQMPLIYLYDLIYEKNLDIDTLTKSELDDLKETLLYTNTFNQVNENKIRRALNFTDLVDILAVQFPIVEKDRNVIYEKYVDLIQKILTDAFEHLFDLNLPISYVTKFKDEEYAEHDQRDVEKFTNKMCQLNTPIPFDVYFSENSCNTQTNKSQYNTCQLDEINPEYIADMKKQSSIKTTIKTSPKMNILKSVFLDGNKLSDSDIKTYWPNWITMKNNTTYKDNPELLYETLFGRMEKKGINRDRIELKYD